MKRVLLALAIVGLVSSTPAYANQKTDFDATRLTEAGRKAYEKLLNSTVFRVGGVGYSGSMSLETDLLRTVLREENATEALRSLVENGSPEGSLYGLVGLHVKSSELFEKELKHLRSKPVLPAREVSFSVNETISLASGEVFIQEGCLWMQMSLQQVLARIDEGQYAQFARWFSSPPSNTKP
jgi:hypothetical protein